jgi:hypothetical protein
VVCGSALAAVGFYLLAGRLTRLSLSSQWVYVMIAGGGIGLMLTPASTDAVNRAPSTSYSEVTGITQTARNFGASLGLAILGAVLVSRNAANITRSLARAGVPRSVAHRLATSLGSAAGPHSSSHQPHALVHDVQLAFAHSTQTVLYIMAAVMAATFVVTLRGLPRRRAEAADPDVLRADIGRAAARSDAELALERAQADG